MATGDPAQSSWYVAVTEFTNTVCNIESIGISSIIVDDNHKVPSVILKKTKRGIDMHYVPTSGDLT